MSQDGELRVAILGAGGTIAPAIVRDLAESGEVSELLLLDLDEGRAQRVAREHGGGKAHAAHADARAAPGQPGSVGRAVARCDVLVNSASYRVNLDAMRACLAAECHYLDLGGLYWMTARQLELDSDFERAGLLALLGIGSAPGKTNLMAVRAVAELGEVDSIAIGAAGRDLDPPRGFSVPYALQTLLDELTMAPVLVREGRPVEVEPLSPAGSVDFGEPIGRRDTIYTLHSELHTLPQSLGCREASFRLSLEPALLARLRELRGASAERVARAAAEAQRPSSNTMAVHMVEATAAGGRHARVRCLTRPHRRWGLGGGVVSTAAPAAAAVRLLARGEIGARGVRSPERALDPKAMFAELEPRGCELDIAVTLGAVAA